MGEGQRVTIARLGARGDGIADTAGGPQYVRFALPGEIWNVESSGEGVCVQPRPDRITPLCSHFGTCGGCMSQHMPAGLYAAWKQRAVEEAFAHRGIEVKVDRLLSVSPGSRRRAFLGVERRGREVLIGFREEGQHTLVDMRECPVLEPVIVAALGLLKDMARVAMPPDKSGRLVVTRTDNGLDVAFDNGLKILSPEERTRLAKLADEARLVRLTVAGDLVVQRGAATITIAGVPVEPPPGIFLQAVPAAEEIMIDLVLQALPKKAKRVGDLFSGIGTFTFPVARRASVFAFDNDKRAISVLEHAARNVQGLKPIEAKVRDLFREPLSPRELDAFDCVVFDPPRAGAADQAARLARSKVATVIAVSCAPATLARDARSLIDGGYKMGAVTLVDQFLFTPHTEALAVFTRGR